MRRRLIEDACFNIAAAGAILRIYLDEERGDLMEEIVLGKRVLAAAMKPDGVNVGFNLGSAAGGSIAHLHGHIVPRWNGDNNFMPVLTETRVLPQAIESTWERLTAALVTLPANS